MIVMKIIDGKMLGKAGRDVISGRLDYQNVRTVVLLEERSDWRLGVCKPSGYAFHLLPCK